MNERTQTTSRAGDMLSRVANATRRAFRLFILAVFIFASSVGVARGFWANSSTGLPTPVEEIEHNHEAVVCIRFLNTLRRHSCSQQVLISTPQNPCRNSSANVIEAPPPGHRLSNHLLAPMRC